MRKLLSISMFTLLVTQLGAASPLAQEKHETFESAYRAYQQSLADQDMESTLDNAQAAYELGLEKFGYSNQNSALLGFNYASLLRLNGFGPKTTALLATEAREIAERVHGKDSPDLLQFLTLEIDAQISVFEYDIAEESAKTARKIAREHFGEDSLQYANSLFQLNHAEMKFGWPRAARSRLEDALEIYEAKLDSNDPRKASVLYDLGRFSLAFGNDRDAVQHFNDAIAIYAQDQTNYLTRLSAARAFLVEAYTELEEDDKATEQSKLIGKETAEFGDNQARPQPLIRKKPVYPSVRPRGADEARVHLSFTIDEEGFTTNINVDSVDGHSSFGRAAISALEEWRYAPLYQDGAFRPRYDQKVIITFDLD